MSRLFLLPVRTPRSGSQKIVLTFRSNTVFTKEIGRQVARHNCFPSCVFFLSLYYAVYVSCQYKRGNTELFHIITTRRRDQQQGGGGGGMGKKPKNKFMQGKMPRKKFVQRRRERKKIPSEGRSNCDFYLMYKICQQAC